jgi:hypothetical protein
MTTHPKARQDRLLVQQLDGETLVYDERTHRAHCLDARAGRVWSLCDGTRSVAEIAQAYGEGAQGEAVVSWTVAELAKARLLDDSPSTEREALSRRAMVKRVGLAAIPIILAVTAPRARAAVSSCASVGQPCTTKPCCPGLTCSPSTLICN